METQFQGLSNQNGRFDFVQMMDNVSDFVYYMNTDHKILWVNQSIRKVLGAEPEELVGHYCYEVFHANSAFCPSCPAGRCKETGLAQEGEIPYKNDIILQVKALPVKGGNDEVIGLLIIAKNKADIREVQSAMEDAQSIAEMERTLMNILMDTIPDRIYFKDLNSKFIRVNKAMAARHGFDDPKMSEGLSDFELYTNEHALQAYNDEQAIIQTGNPILNIEEKETFANDRVTWALTSKMPLRNKEGAIFGTFGISHDITNRKLAEEQINRYVKELKELNATKDKFFSIIAHDLRNPFNNILGISELLKDESREYDVETIEEYATMIYSSARQTYELLENLLDWANTHRGHMIFSPENISLHAIAAEVTNNLSQAAVQKNIVLTNAIQSFVLVHADKNMLRSILRNLATNALKFTPRNGFVELSAQFRDDFVVVGVRDNGIGMDASTKEEIFRLDVNHTTPGTENEKGTGLGLMLSKEFVLKHGGEIWVESRPGMGSFFRFTLPLAQTTKDPVDI